MEFREQALYFDCDGDALLGVLTVPTGRAARVGVVVVVGGPQYRVGSHRQFVSLGRVLATAGIACLRFDYRGMGDSEGAPRTFEAIDRDIAAAVGAFTREAGIERVVLWGLCDGASAALMYACNDPRVAGVVAVNPWVRTDATQASARLRHYYLHRIASRAFWTRLLHGDVEIGESLRSVASDARRTASGAAATPFLQRMQEGWMAFERPVLFVLSGNDMAAREFETWIKAHRVRRRTVRNGRCSVHEVSGADHTFSRAQWAREVEALTLRWVAALS